MISPNIFKPEHYFKAFKSQMELKKLTGDQKESNN